MPIERSEWIYYSGDWMRWEDATVHVTAHALHYGTSAFEGIRAYDCQGTPSIFRLDSHVRRLLDSCKMLRFDMCDYDHARLSQLCVDLVARNRHDECYIRPLVFRGVESMGLFPLDCPVEVVLFSFAWGRYLGEEAIEDGIDAQISSWRRFSPGTTMPLGKIGGQYITNQLVSIEARQNGFTEGIMLEHGGFVSEGAGENIFVVRDGRIFTPPASASILEGITRSSVIKIAEDLGIEVEYADIPRELLYVCDELFMSGTAAEVTPVTSVDRIAVGSGVRGPITKSIQDEFFGIISGDVSDRHGWLTAVPQLESAAASD